MAANAFRLRRSLALASSILNRPTNLPSYSSMAAPPSLASSTAQRLFNVNHSKSDNSTSHFKYFSSRARYNNDDMDGDQISPDAILFEGCDYNHWLITMDFPKDPKPSPEEMVETYVQTAAKVLGSVEEAKKKIYACSTTTYNGFQVEVSEEVSEQFKGLPGVVFVLPDSYIDPVNKEYGGDKYINGTIIPRPPPVQYGRQGGRYNDRNRDYNRPPPRGRMEQNYGGPPPAGPGGQVNYQGDRRGPMPSYQNEGEGRNLNPARPTDFPPRDQGNYAHPEQRGFTPPPVGNYNQGGGGGGGYRQGTGGQYGQQGGGNYWQGTGGQSGPGGGGEFGQGGGGGYGRGAGGQFGQGGGGGYGQGTGGQFGQGGGGSYGQGTGGQFGQGYGQGTGGQFGQGGGGSYGQGTGGQFGQGYGQGTGGQFGQGGGGGYGQGTGGGNYGQGGYGAGSGGNFRQGNGGQGNAGDYGHGRGGEYEEAGPIKER